MRSATQIEPKEIMHLKNYTMDIFTQKVHMVEHMVIMRVCDRVT